MSCQYTRRARAPSGIEHSHITERQEAVSGARHRNINEIRSVIKERGVPILRRMHGGEDDDVAIGSLQRMDGPDSHLIPDTVLPEEFAQRVFLVSEWGEDAYHLLQLLAPITVL